MSANASVPPSHEAGQDEIAWPPGYAEWIARFIHAAAPRPVKEVAIVGALGLLSGICGKEWTIPGSGLNNYIILVARSAIGKEAMLTGISMLVNSVAQKVPLARGFVDFSDFASGPALVKAVATNPCFVNVAGEFGHKFVAMADGPDAPMQSLRRAMTNLYSKSAATSTAGGVVYSDKEKNVGSVIGAAFSLIGETTPTKFYNAITKDMMEDGFMSRFTMVEYQGDRPEKNPAPLSEPWPELVNMLVGLTTHSITLRQRNQHQAVGRDPNAVRLLDEFEAECDRTINAAGDDESRRQMWNRAHLKVLRISALLAVADNPYSPSITAQHAEWAVTLVRRDIAVFNKRLQSGEIGLDDRSRERALLKVASEYLCMNPDEVPGYAKPWEKMRLNGVIPRKYMQLRVQRIAAFENHKLGSTRALDDTLRTMLSNGHIMECDKSSVSKNYGFHGKCFMVLELEEFRTRNVTSDNWIDQLLSRERPK